MNPWNIIVSIFVAINSLFNLLYEFAQWRFHLCTWGAIILAVIAAGLIDTAPLRWIVAGVIAATGLIIGILWDRGR